MPEMQGPASGSHATLEVAQQNLIINLGAFLNVFVDVFLDILLGY